MSQLILDSIAQKDVIGKAIAEFNSKGHEQVNIVSPYISDTDSLLDINGIKSLRILCNARAAACNPYTLETLINRKNIEVRSRSDIHAKVYFFSDSAYITSANATPNGLGAGTIEACVKISDKVSLRTLGNWLSNLWNNSHTEDVSRFTKKEWENLKTNWRLSGDKSSPRKPMLIDLIRSRTIPGNIAFCFWNDADMPAAQKEKVYKKAETLYGFKLPEGLDNLDYYMDDMENEGFYTQTENLLNKFYRFTFINIYARQWPFIQVYKKHVFASRILFEKPIRYKYKNKQRIITLIRTEDMPIKVDQQAIALINSSLERNKLKWGRYFKSVEGEYGFCSTKTLYRIIEGCV